MSYPALDAPAPIFSLPNQDGELVNLSDFRGSKHIALYFYPKASTPGCTTQACGLRDSIKELAAHDVVILGVSPDPVDKIKRFSEKYELPFMLLADEEHKVADAYGVWGMKKFMGKEFMGLIRTTFIIDNGGNLRCVMDKFKTKTHHETLLETIVSLGL